MTPGYNLSATSKFNDELTTEPNAAVTDINKYEVTVWFDLDETLFIMSVNKEIAAYCANKQNLTKTLFKYLDITVECHLIFKKRTAELFKFLSHPDRNNKVRIGFITAGGWLKHVVLPFLESSYDLVPGTLEKCMFINCNDLGNHNTPKGEKLDLLIKGSNLFQPNERIILLDDNISHVQSVIRLGYIGIPATFTQDCSDAGIEYLDDVQYEVEKILTANSLLGLQSSTPNRSTLKPN